MIARNKRPLRIEAGLNPDAMAQICRNYVRVHVSYRAFLRARAFRPDMVLNNDLDVQTRLGAASIALPFLYPRLSATTVDARSTVVKIDGNALIEKLNARLERLAEVPAGIIEGVTADAVEAA